MVGIPVWRLMMGSSRASVPRLRLPGRHGAIAWYTTQRRRPARPPSAQCRFSACLCRVMPPRSPHLHEPPEATSLFVILIPIIAGRVLHATRALRAGLDPKFRSALLRRLFPRETLNRSRFPKLHSGPSNPALTPLSERRPNLTDTSGAPAADYLIHHARAANVIVAVFSGMTVGDGPVSERRGSRRVYRKSARDAFLSGNGTDPMHGRKTIAARPTWTGLTDQPNQDRPGRRVRIPHTSALSTDRTPATDTAEDVPAEPGTSYDTDDPGRKVMSPETENCMK